MPYQALADKLVPFETFDRSAFIEDDKVPQRVCDLVLSLALAFDDLRDLFFARALLSEVIVHPQGYPTPHLGLRNALETVIVRIQIGFIHELFNLLKTSSTAIAEPAFTKLLRQMSKAGKNAWKALHDVAMDKPSNDPLAHALLLIRNKVAFHYDTEQLGRGYRAAFFDTNIFGQPLLSRGSNMLQTRFYFADAASNAYILSKAEGTRTYEFLQGEGALLESVNQALYEIVTRFIQIRSAWSKPHLASPPMTQGAK